MYATVKVFKYTKETECLGLFMPVEQKNKLIMYCDSDWEACFETKKPVTSYIVKFENVLIFYKSNK